MYHTHYYITIMYHTHYYITIMYHTHYSTHYDSDLTQLHQGLQSL